MALPIRATPILRGKEAAKFLTKVHNNSNKPLPLTPTPKLKKAEELVDRYAKDK